MLQSNNDPRYTVCVDLRHADISTRNRLQDSMYRHRLHFSLDIVTVYFKATVPKKSATQMQWYDVKSF